MQRGFTGKHKQRFFERCRRQCGKATGIHPQETQPAPLADGRNQRSPPCTMAPMNMEDEARRRARCSTLDFGDELDEAVLCPAGRRHAQNLWLPWADDGELLQLRSEVVQT